ncbi:carboxypeptidase-like regulatory domain-containing protein [Mucilaginibacter lutimaris]|uniref:Carboxypeptidase-like regulatory domain-containing protein n=1 Tax=Mucilaginibacter lutimaris TaxID=931629 RepID=A0ABW2ZM46_9SPHI
MKKLFIIFSVVCFSTSILYAQNKTIKGKVIDDNLETLPFVSIFISDTIKVGKTALDGFFKIDIPVSVKKITLRTVGLEPATIKIEDECNDVEVIMMLSGSYDFMPPNRVDKLRMKKFRKLPNLHKEAFEKGIFKTDKACYTQEFTYYHKSIKN